MKNTSFNEGVVVALVSSISVSALFSLISYLLLGGGAFKLLIAGISFFYIMYLLLRTKERTGRVTVILIWFIATLLSLVFVSSILLYVSIQLFMVWLLRSIYFYNSIFSALIDLTLTGMSVVIAVWTWSVSESMFLTVWSFFLMQALFVFIPKSFNTKEKPESIADEDNDRFEYAYHTAEMAVEKLINRK
ncbi:MAG: hypothetical protein BMS9Abin31_0577 [Gammaproteobacteria bacterium]|nr:MAG: hypothetical protein BMS9Abin31_0577 [Gammaproteobacteria bacterium]